MTVNASHSDIEMRETNSLLTETTPSFRKRCSQALSSDTAKKVGKVALGSLSVITGVASIGLGIYSATLVGDPNKLNSFLYALGAATGCVGGMGLVYLGYHMIRQRPLNFRALLF